MKKNRMAFCAGMAMLLAVPEAHAKQGLTNGLWNKVYAVNVTGTMRIGPEEAPNPYLGSRPADTFRATDDEVFLEQTIRTRTLIRRYTFRFTERIDKKTLSGQVHYCSTIVRTGRTTCLDLNTTATSIERRQGEQEGWRLGLLGETRLDPPWARAAGAVQAGADVEALHEEEGGEGHEHGGATDAGQPAVNVRVAGNLAYVARYGDGLVVVDVSDLAHPRPVGWAPVLTPGEIYNDVKIAPVGPYVLMTGSASGLVSIDVSDPTNPRTVARWPESGFNDVHTLYVEGTRAYLADITLGGIRIVDVSNPAAPLELGQFRVATADNPFAFTHDLMVRNGIAYLSSWDSGLVVVDCNNPAAPVELGRFTYPDATSHSVWVNEIDGRLIAVHGDESIGAHLRVLDVTDPAHITLLSEWQTRPEVSIHNVSLFDSRVYMAHYQDGVRVLDLRKGSMPKEVGYYNTWSFGDTTGYSFFEGVVGIDVDLGRNLIFAADSHRGLLILQEQAYLSAPNAHQ